MGKLFISHSSLDDGIVGELRKALELHLQDAWIDSRELCGGDPLWSKIQQGIEAASAYAVVISPASNESKWVKRELDYALKLQQQRNRPPLLDRLFRRKASGKDLFPVIPLLLDGSKPGSLGKRFGEEAIHISISSKAGGIDAALNAILVALGQRLNPDYSEASSQPKQQPLEELVLKLTDLKIYEQDGLRRAQAKASLVYEPATPGRREVASEQAWRFIAPIGPIEADELRWYLEKYAIWPSRYYKGRADKVEADLVNWGKLLHDAALPQAATAKVLSDWKHVTEQASRRFSVYVDTTPEAGASAAEANAAQEAATLLLGLPWELLHDGQRFLFQGAKAVRVRRRLPNTQDGLNVTIVEPPIRILLVTARPEDDACGYLDHRASALPLVDAMEALGGLVQIHLLDPPTLPALSQELARARSTGKPYHVVHFDGHGVYDRRVGLGGLCFEDPQDLGKLENRRHKTIYTNELGPLLSEHRIPLVFLEACQTAQADSASESVASELLKVGVAAVVAMSHSVLVETARRFVEAFYQALAEGQRVGDAMLAGQRDLKDDTFRRRVFGAGELRLEDWFVPVLFQEKDDPQLFRAIPAWQTKQDVLTSLQARFGATPPPPDTGFIGRSRDLLALQRLLSQQRYAVVRGQGGEGKTALACEFARWLVRSQQIRRVAFVSVEMHSTAAAVLDAIGRQLVPGYSVAAFKTLEQAIQPVERALQEQATLLVLDNMESILLPPYLAATTPEALSEDARQELDGILSLCARLLGGSCQTDSVLKTESVLSLGATRLLFTSREALPAPFDADRNRRELHRLSKDDAVKLVERALNSENGVQGWTCTNPQTGASLGLHSNGASPALHSSADAQTEAIERLVESVHGHARTLALLAPNLRQHGVEQTCAALLELMAQMDQRYPPSHPEAREKSVYAGVALSLNRLSPEALERARVLGVFQGGVDLDMLAMMMQWEKADVVALAEELIATGLATANPYNHLSLNPALCPYLLKSLDAAEQQALTARWVAAMRAYVDFLYQQSNQNAEIAATLTGLELPNVFALLEFTRQAGDAEGTIDLATSLYRLLQFLGKPRLLERVGQVRDAAAAALGETWSHARFEAQRSRIEQQLASGRLPEALAGAKDLLRQARTAGGQAYPGADYDLAMACILLARVSRFAGAAEPALALLDEARRGFEAIAQQQANKAAEGMASVCLAERGDCLVDLGRLDAAAAAYEENIRRAEQLGDERQVAVGQGQLGTVRLYQRRYPEALAAYTQAREHFTRLDEPGTVAAIWHQTGMAYQDAGQAEMAEDAYRQSLAIKVRLGNVAGQASTLVELGNLYMTTLGRTEESVPFYREAANKYAEISDVANEGKARSGLAIALRILHRYDDARQEICCSIKCSESF